MFDVFLRAIRNPIDYRRLFTRHHVTLRERIDEGCGIYSFIFDMPKPFSWRAGQHAVWRFPDNRVDGKDWRAFSVASSPHENVLRIGTIISETPSNFKEHLLKLKPGDEMIINGPFGEFHINHNPQQIIGIAGGIGITPFRSLAYEIANGYLPDTKLTLIYSARDNYTYKDELDQWQQSSSQIKIIYTHTPEEVNTTLDQLIATHGNQAYYYLSGSPGMIKALRASCLAKHITKIVNDPFKGY